MVKEIQMFEDSNGTPHRDKRDAMRADLAILFARTGAVNEASAKQMVDALVDDDATKLIELREAVQGVINALPQVVAA